MDYNKLFSELIKLSSASARYFLENFKDWRTTEYVSPSEYISKYWDKHLKMIEINKDYSKLSGITFELLIGTLLIREKFFPFYKSATVSFVPNVVFDYLLYSKLTGPICLSCKTSLRERYKQADLEAIALKNVHRKALCYLLTMEENEARVQKSKIEDNEITGLNDIIVCSNEEFDQLIDSLRQYKLEKPEKVEIIIGNAIMSD